MENDALRRLSFAFAILVLMMSTVGIIVSRNLVEFFLCAKLISVSSFFIFFTVVISAILSDRIEAESVFAARLNRALFFKEEERELARKLDEVVNFFDCERGMEGKF